MTQKHQNPGAQPARDDPMRRIDSMRERIVAAVARNFAREQQAEALGLLAQALLMEVRHRSSTEYASGCLDVMHAIFEVRLDAAARATVHLADLGPALH